MGISHNGDYDDVNSSEYETTEITLNNLTETLITTGISKRQILFVRNKGPGKILIGPQGGVKDLLMKGQTKTWNLAENIEIYAIAETASSPIIFVEEAG